MSSLKEFLEATNYSITGGTEFQWQCFGPNARYLDSDKENKYSTSVIFDSVTQTLYVIEAWDYVNNREYRWVHPFYVERYKAEHVERAMDSYETSLDDKKFIDIELEEDIFEKIAAMHAGKEYDTRVKVPIDFSDEELLKYMTLAHEMDMTFNQFIEMALREAIEKEGILERD
jgi:hypothetical protein